MVRDAERELAAFRLMRRQLPRPLRAITPVGVCSTAFARAIERRSRRVNVPWVIGINHWIRPLVHSRPVELLMAHRSAGVLLHLEAEITALGRSTSERIAQLQSNWHR
jgi:hypothetical protein